MKSNILLVFLALCPFIASAQNRVEISYVSPDSISETMRDIMDFQDIKYMKIKVHGDIKGKKWKLWANEVHGEKMKSGLVFPHAFEFSDTLATFTFIAQDKNDTVKITCKTPRYTSPKRYAICTANGTEYPTPYILIETIPSQPYTTMDEIKLVAYASGIRLGIGQYSFCDLRNAQTDPKQWQVKYEIPRFVYFSLRLE